MSSHSSSLISLWDPPCWNSFLKEDEVAKFSALLASNWGFSKKGSEIDFHLSNNAGVLKQDPYQLDLQVQYT